jgi:hypothetical protein
VLPTPTRLKLENHIRAQHHVRHQTRPRLPLLDHLGRQRRNAHPARAAPTRQLWPHDLMANHPPRHVLEPFAPLAPDLALRRTAVRTHFLGRLQPFRHRLQHRRRRRREQQQQNLFLRQRRLDARFRGRPEEFLLHLRHLPWQLPDQIMRRRRRGGERGRVHSLRRSNTHRAAKLRAHKLFFATDSLHVVVRYHPRFGRTSNPVTNATNSSPRTLAHPPPSCGHENRPRSNRFAHTHNPEPSQNKIFSRLREHVS